MKTFHKEYLSTPIIIQESNPFELFSFKNRWVLTIFILISIITILESYVIGTIVFLALMCLLIPNSMGKSDSEPERILLVITDKFIQHKGKLLVWNHIRLIRIQTEKSDGNCTYTIFIKCMNGKEIGIDTIHFEEQQEIIGDFRAIAKKKKITFVDKRPFNHEEQAE